MYNPEKRRYKPIKIFKIKISPGLEEEKTLISETVFGMYIRRSVGEELKNGIFQK